MGDVTIDGRNIYKYGKHANYTTEPPTVSTIFATLSHYEHPQVLLVNLSNIFSIVNNYKHYFFILLHYKYPSVMSKTIMIIIVTFIII